MLNEQQQALVNFIDEGEGSCILIARAGTGKTHTLVQGAVRTIVENHRGKTAVLMAFNKSAATEFQQRINALMQETGNARFQEIETGTVHSLGFKAIRASQRFTKVDGYKTSNICRDLFGDANNRGYYRLLPQVTKLVSIAKQTALSPDDLLNEGEALIEHFDIDANGDTEEVIENAAEVLRKSNAIRDIIDFDDMIYFPVFFNLRVEQFDFVLIDEAQDTNEVRRLLAFKMMKPNGRLIAVGDDKQAIYGFTGANSNSLDLIREALNAITLPLTVTYRCPKAVVKEANRIVSDFIAHETAPEGIVRTIHYEVEVN